MSENVLLVILIRAGSLLSLSRQLVERIQQFQKIIFENYLTDCSILNIFTQRRKESQKAFHFSA